MLPEPGSHVGTAVSTAGSRGAEASALQLVQEPRARMRQRSDSWWWRQEQREEPVEEECRAQLQGAFFRAGHRSSPGALGPGTPNYREAGTI